MVKNSVLCGAALSCAFLCAACGGTSFTRTGTPPHALTPRTPEGVVVLAAPPPNAIAVEVGRLEASTGVSAPGSEAAQDLLAQLLKVAGENGCDSILPGPPEEALAATSSGTPLYKTTQTAVCFVNR